MSREAFETTKLRPKSLSLIEHSNRIISEYQALGFVLTLRQLFYQFVSRCLIDNTQSDYKRLGIVVKSGRRAGLIDWDAIEDRTRNVRRPSAWSRSSIRKTCGVARLFGPRFGSRRMLCSV